MCSWTVTFSLESEKTCASTGKLGCASSKHVSDDGGDRQEVCSVALNGQGQTVDGVQPERSPWIKFGSRRIFGPESRPRGSFCWSLE